MCIYICVDVRVCAIVPIPTVVLLAPSSQALFWLCTHSGGWTSRGGVVASFTWPEDTEAQGSWERAVAPQASPPGCFLPWGIDQACVTESRVGVHRSQPSAARVPAAVCLAWALCVPRGSHSSRLGSLPPSSNRGSSGQGMLLLTPTLPVTARGQPSTVQGERKHVGPAPRQHLASGSPLLLPSVLGPLAPPAGAG